MLRAFKKYIFIIIVLTGPKIVKTFLQISFE